MSADPTLSDRAVAQGDLLPYLNRQLIPFVRRLRSRLDGLSTVTTTLAGDVTGSLAAAVVERIRGTNVLSAAPSANQVLLFDGSSWAPTSGVSGIPIATKVSLAFSTSVANVDKLAYTVPGTGNGRFAHALLLIRLSTAITGGGNVILTAGTTSGGNDLLTASSAWDNTTAVGTVFGRSLAYCGTSTLAADGYITYLNGGATVYVRAATGGGGITGGAAEIYTFGGLIQ